MTLQLDIFSTTQETSAPTPTPPKTIEGRFRAFHGSNPHVLAEMLRLARARLDRGEKYISVKALWEELRVSLAWKAKTDAEYKLNNNYTAHYARQLLDLEPRLDGVIQTRRRKSK